MAGAVWHRRPQHLPTLQSSQLLKELMMFATRFGLASVLACAALSAQAAAGSTGIDASGNYKQEVEACKSGQTQQDQATCLREAGSARAEKQRGTLGKADSQLEANAKARCDVLTGED